MRCSIIDNKIESGEEELQQEAPTAGHPANSMFNQLFESSPGLGQALPSGRTHYNETILENSQE